MKLEINVKELSKKIKRSDDEINDIVAQKIAESAVGELVIDIVKDELKSANHVLMIEAIELALKEEVQVIIKDKFHKEIKKIAKKVMTPELVEQQINRFAKNFETKLLGMLDYF